MVPPTPDPGVAALVVLPLPLPNPKSVSRGLIIKSAGLGFLFPRGPNWFALRFAKLLDEGGKWLLLLLILLLACAVNCDVDDEVAEVAVGGGN